MNKKVEVLFAEAIDELQRMEQICFGTEAWTAETMEAWFSLPTVRFSAYGKEVFFSGTFALTIRRATALKSTVLPFCRNIAGRAWRRV